MGETERADFVGTERIFQADAYLSTMEATLIRIEGENGLVFDRTNFYATGGGQPGDRGFVEQSDGTKIQIVETAYSSNARDVVMFAGESALLPELGETLTLHIDWKRRYKLMRMHTACHLLSVVCPYPITGAAVGEEESRIDFDWPEAAAEKQAISERVMEIVAANHPVFTKTITEAELEATPGLVKSANVKPPKGTCVIRLVCIGENSSVDAQPCGGTHVSETGEVGEVHIGKIEKKGKANRRMRIRFGPIPA
ncbi:Alanyl-transfer RNA synthetase [Fulvimarina pelagi HTCC2506]|uniref:Alanine--tRNA ligase n=2 Tax=Fulvimarina pelagi TaxID=217511 RepID=Q0FZI8_9HYPH|nr:alanyl-tRNA editing protein [Fulvimarina pelagi]EAU40290.1 Alanyl-transfer RNA synthetase [Fulvimarina pelagi HTCC2506]BAT31330.1 alanyl-transfer RNA synthetase [Fulvimarina pelagi]